MVTDIAEWEDNSDRQELEDFISAQKSSNTVKKTKSDMRALKRLNRFVPQLTKQENQKLWLQRNSTNYFQDFLKILQQKMAKSTNRVHSRHFKEAFQRYFSEKKLPFNIFEDDEFSRSRQVLAAQNERASFKVVSATSQTLLGN